MASASPIYDDEGNIIAGSVIWCDRTKQKELEMKLDQKASYDFLTGIFQNTSFDLGILLAETLRHKIENHPIITKAGTINITTSIGIFSTSDKDEKFDTLEDVLSKIDCAL